MYGRNGPKFVILISILWYPQKWKRQILAHKNYPVAEKGVSKLLCSQSFLLLSPYKTIAFHNTTKGGRLSGRIVIIISLIYITKYCMTISSQTCFEVRRKCGVGFIHTQLASSHANAPQKLASSPCTVGFITRDFHALISRQHSQTYQRGLYTLFLTSKSRCMQKISSVDALLTIQNVLSWSGRFGGGHTRWSQLQLASSVRWSQLQLASSVSPLWYLITISVRCLATRQGHATTKIFNFIRNVVVMGQMLFLDSMEKNNFQLADGYPICTFSSFCELVGFFFHRPAILFHSAASW